MTYGIARAATSPELTLYRTPGKTSKWRAAIFTPHVIYQARINQTFSTYDGVLEITYDTGSGTLAHVLGDMMLLVGSSAGAHDKGICRIRNVDSTKFYISETSDISWADNLYLTVVDNYALWARHVLISGGVPYMDGGVAYSDQHDKPDPTPIMGSHRVLKLTGASVSTQFDGSASYVVGGLSSISSYAWTCLTASASSGTTTATPTFTFNSVGWHLVYLTVTAANSKICIGIRYVYVWNDANPPVSMEISDPRQDIDSGGWEFEILAVDGVDLSEVPDHTLVILFAEDRFGSTQSDIGPVAGSENVEVTGWIAKEVNNANPEHPTTTFTVYTAQYWLGQIPAFPDGVEFVTGTPSAWTEFQNLTVDKGLWHFLHWRTTATRVMDVFLSGDTKYTKEVSSLGSNLWEQIREMAFSQIYARTGVNAWNQLFIQVHPQLTPAGSRTWAMVMTIQKGDWQGELDFERVTKPECAIVSLSGVSVNSSGVGSSFFALSPGHAYPHYGSIEVQDRLLVSDQAQANGLAGLYRGWRNNPYPEIPIPLAADIRLIDCFPRSKCAISISAGDTPRGIAFSGNLLPTAVSIVTDPETGRRYREVTFEAETSEDISVNGDVPGGREDPSVPPTPKFPPLPDFPVILPGIPELSEGGPTKVILHDPTYGLIYSADFNSGYPHWITVNAGLTATQYQKIDAITVTPSGAIYVAYRNSSDLSSDIFIAYAPSIGASFTVIEDLTSIQAKHAGTIVAVVGLSVNKLNGQVGYILVGNTSDAKLYIGTGTSFTGYTITGYRYQAANFAGMLSYGGGNWLVTGPTGAFVHAAYFRMGAGGTSVTASGDLPISSSYQHIRVSTTGTTFHSGFFSGTDNCASFTTLTDTIGGGGYLDNVLDTDPTGTFLMCNGLGAAHKARSSDGGATWVAIPSLPVGNHRYAYAGGDGVSSRWVAASGIVRYSPDWGDTWENKEGDLLSISAIPGIDAVRVVSF